MTEPIEKPLLLFVDDEEDVLAGLRNTLRKRRDEWAMRFAVGAAAGLEIVRSAPVDVVVSDMRMPGMDGASFLAEARRLRPEAVRIVLSGQADAGATMRGLAVAQQWLAKPCSRESLVRALELALTARSLIRSTERRIRLGDVESLPSPPVILERIQTLVADPDCRIEDVAETIGQDPAVAAKILRVANSAYYVLAQEITSLEAAIHRLGLDTVSALVVSESLIRSLAGPPQREGAAVEAIRRRSLVCARLAAGIARAADKRDESLVSTAFTGGLLHEVGRLVSLATEWDEDGAHPAIGGGLLAAWGLPMRIVECAARHLDLEALPGVPDPAAVCVHVARHLIDELDEKRVPGRAPREPLSSLTLSLCGADASLDRLRRLAAELDAAGDQETRS